MWEKALLFNDYDSAELILKTPLPNEVKKLGRLVKNFDTALWEKNRFTIMYNVCFAKFDQNENLKKELSKTSSKIKKKKIMYKIRILNGMVDNNINPKSMVLTHVPIVPPDLRPMVQLTGGRFATSDLNDLYRR
jgi:DNA-directed RNA polymerase beta' subunit